MNGPVATSDVVEAFRLGDVCVDIIKVTHDSVDNSHHGVRFRLHRSESSDTEVNADVYTYDELEKLSESLMIASVIVDVLEGRANVSSMVTFFLDFFGVSR